MTYQIKLSQGGVHRITEAETEADIVDAVTRAIGTLSGVPRGFTIEVRNLAPAADQGLREIGPHEFTSEGGAPEGGLGPCAVCGTSRGAAVHR